MSLMCKVRKIGCHLKRSPCRNGSMVRPKLIYDVDFYTCNISLYTELQFVSTEQCFRRNRLETKNSTKMEKATLKCFLKFKLRYLT